MARCVALPTRSCWIFENVISGRSPKAQQISLIVFNVRFPRPFTIWESVGLSTPIRSAIWDWVRPFSRFALITAVTNALLTRLLKRPVALSFALMFGLKDFIC